MAGFNQGGSEVRKKKRDRENKGTYKGDVHGKRTTEGEGRGVKVQVSKVSVGVSNRVITSVSVMRVSA